MKAIYLFVLFSVNYFNHTKNDLNTYETHIDQAENFIIQGNISEAHLYYKRAQAIRDNMYAVDINNGLICAILLKDWKMAAVWSKKLVAKGVPERFFDKKLFDDFFKTNYGKVFKYHFLTYQNEFFVKRNDYLSKKLRELEESDQKVYCGIPNGDTDLNYAFNSTKSIDSILVNLFEKFGFPSEETIGVNYNDETDEISPVPQFSALYRHSYQSNSKLLDTYLKNALNNGTLKKSSYLLFTGKSNFSFGVIDCKIYQNMLMVEKDSLNMKNKRSRILFNNLLKEEYKYFIIYEPLAVFDSNFKKTAGSSFSKVFTAIGNYADCNE